MFYSLHAAPSFSSFLLILRHPPPRPHPVHLPLPLVRPAKCLRKCVPGWIADLIMCLVLCNRAGQVGGEAESTPLEAYVS